ncbi:hypothetical protein BDW66DRAFT_138604 [Aspergillus desertorum]
MDELGFAACGNVSSQTSERIGCLVPPSFDNHFFPGNNTKIKPFSPVKVKISYTGLALHISSSAAGPSFISTQCQATAIYRGTKGLGFDTEGGQALLINHSLFKVIHNSRSVWRYSGDTLIVHLHSSK